MVPALQQPVILICYFYILSNSRPVHSLVLKSSDDFRGKTVSLTPFISVADHCFIHTVKACL